MKRSVRRKPRTVTQPRLGKARVKHKPQPTPTPQPTGEILFIGAIP